MNVTTLKNSSQNFIQAIWTKKKEKKVWISAGVLVIALVYMFVGGSVQTDTFIYTIQPREFVQKVSLTGKVIAAKNVDMGFETSSRVQKVAVAVGDRVKKGAILASLANGDYVSAVQKSSALAQAEQARFQDLTATVTPEDKKLAEDNVAGAQIDVSQSEQTLLDQIKDLYAKADDAIRFNIDPSFRDPRSQNPEFIYLIDQNTVLRDSLKTQRVEIGLVLTHVNDTFSIDKIQTYRSEIQRIQKFINDVNTAISIVSEKANAGNDATYSAQVATQKASISLARTAFSSSLALFNQTESSYKNSVNILTRYKNQLSVVLASATPTQIAIQRANIESARASVGSASAQLSKTVIRAPFDGVITAVDIKEGEISSPNKPIISMLNDGEYQIETFVSENDIAKLQVNQPANITLDAYGRNVFFKGVVISVDPAETVKDGVSTYRTKIQFVEKDEKVKSGMTANIDIETNRRPSIIQIPQTAIILDSGVKKVKLLSVTSCVPQSTSTEPVSAPQCTSMLDDSALISIQTGEISSNGDIEIISGITEGQTVIYNSKAQ
jgi:RND family efflux transporter MFP subunit